MMGGLKFLVALFVLTAVAGGKNVGVQAVHHVVGGDRETDTSADVGPWFSGQVFRVGDSLLFRYSSPEETIVELGSVDEYHACDLTNPIRMYTDGVNKIPLEEEGTRYFASSSLEKCKSGSKLPVHVTPNPNPNPVPSFDTPPGTPFYPEPTSFDTPPDAPFYPEPIPFDTPPDAPYHPEPFPGTPPPTPFRPPPTPTIPPPPALPSSSTTLNLNTVLLFVMLFGCVMRLV